ncbi:hypothetical protein QTP88_013143 [Uroleucon formosanum]
MVRYLETTYGRNPTMYEEIKSCIENMRGDFKHSIAQGKRCSDPGYANEIKTLSASALAHLWYEQDISEALATVDMGNDIDTSYSPPTPSFPEIGEQKCSNMTSPRRPMSPSSFLAGYDFY